MAALVSHAMRRYPLSPPDGVYSSYNLRGDNNTSWSQTPEEGESALSRSMRYADPWLYGSVRGAPAGALVLAPAFVLCSCPDYLNGTKKAGQKKGPTLCKKCKGTRVALTTGNGDTKFGTVRCYPTSSSSTTLHSISSNTQVRAGTVRVTSSCRPSILPNTADPYDLMRKSRLNASSSEPTSPFRGRSVSPKRRSNGSSKTSGRRSILECDINPYELMSTETEQTPKDSSITFVNGQRIRVRPQAPDPDYEDIDEKLPNKPPQKLPQSEIPQNPLENVIKTPRPKPNRIAPDPPFASPLISSEADRNNSFKSILKKSSNFKEPLMHSPTPVHPKSGSHFYLPLPSTTRKKVQFLVENCENSQESRRESMMEPSSDYEDIESHDESIEYPEVFEEEKNIIPAENDNRMCTLRRSTSERYKVEPPKVVFHDTMALRSKTPRVDSRDTFNNCDLEKLDGLVAMRKTSPRPRDPPPRPPSQEDQESGIVENELKNVKIQNSENKQRTVVLRNNQEQSRSKQNSVEQVVEERPQFPQEPTKNPSFNLIKELVRKISDSSSDSDQGRSTKSSDHCQSRNENGIELISESESNSESERSSSSTKIQHFKNISSIASDSTEDKSKPQAPPRKRSNNKQPNINIQTTKDQNFKVEKYESDEEINLSLHENQIADGDVKVPLPRKRSGNKQPNIKLQMVSDHLSTSIITPISHLNTMAITEKNVMETQVLTEKVEEEFIDDSSVQLREGSEIGRRFWNSKPGYTEEKDKNDYTVRTVVQIAPSSPVHKIQIKNEFPEPTNIQTISIIDNAQRKTSIMINGDDCYSTVNVSDDVPLYQSSVVVRDYGVTEFVPKYNRRSSSVYITGSFHEESSTNINTSKEVEEMMNDMNRADTCICNNSSKNKEVTKEEKVEKEISTENKDTDRTDHDNSYCMRPSTPDMIREILRDPVEAVKRNLVPHICGKSDVPRRPRDIKLKNYYPMMLLTELAAGSPDSKENSPKSPLRVCTFEALLEDDKDACSEHSSSTQYEFVDPGSDCYTDHSNRSSVTEEELANRTKFYELLADSTLLEVSENDDHHYECISKNDSDPIYEEIEIPPPLPSNPPPVNLLDDLKLDKEFTTRSIFEGASKYDILSYLVDAKERGIVPEDSYTFSNCSVDDSKERNAKLCHMSSVSDSSEDNSLVISGALNDDKTGFCKSSEVERNDSGVGSETSKCSLSKYRSKPVTSASCEDCETSLESLGENEPMLCRKCLKKRSERKEIIMEIVETEEKYSKDLQIVLEEFYQPMLVAGLLTPEQLSTIFLNVEELLENSQSLAERLRDAVEIATEQGDEDLLTVNIGKLFLEAAPMLHAFETYCVRQGPASLLLASLEKEKELLRIFLRVSQMENTLLRRMNLNSFLMVPVQRVTKYPLLLARLYKVSPNHNEAREQLKEAQHKIELHLNHMNSQTKDVPSKLWRRIGSSSGRRPSTEMDLVNIKLRKIAVDVLEWNHEEAKFALEGKLWFTQPTDNNWRKGRTIKLSPVNALLVINGKPTNTSKTEREENALIFPKHSPTREAALLLVRDKNGRYSMLRDPLYLDRCVIASDPSWQSYFEVQELLGKDTFIFKAEDEDQTRIWYQQLQFHAQGMGAWRKRRNALANIMMNGMGLRL